jgi:hypothetical protein
LSEGGGVLPSLNFLHHRRKAGGIGLHDGALPGLLLFRQRRCGVAFVEREEVLHAMAVGRERLWAGTRVHRAVEIGSA